MFVLSQYFLHHVFVFVPSIFDFVQGDSIWTLIWTLISLLLFESG